MSYQWLMKRMAYGRAVFLCGWLFSSLLRGAALAPAEPVSPSLVVAHGAVNGARLEREGHFLLVYGDPGRQWPAAEAVLLTHARREVVWAARSQAEAGAKLVAPEGEAMFLAAPGKFWANLLASRFHDYQQQTTKWPAEPFPAPETVRGNTRWTWRGLDFQVLETPGYTRGAVSYVARVDGQKVAFTGDLVQGDGRLPDLYSLQDAIPEAKIGGYHGYAGRLGEVVASLQRLRAEQPDLLVPARGPVIRDPRAAIDQLLLRLRKLYANYLSIDALRWYFGEQHILNKARRVLGPEAQPAWMPMAQTNALPAWVIAIDNARLLLSTNGAGYLIDCGGKGILNRVIQLKDSGQMRHLEGVFITHYHDDHTDQVPALVKRFGCPVQAVGELCDVLAKPGAYRLPAMTANPIPIGEPLADKTRWRWHEFTFTAYDFPGQTLYHDALLVEKPGEDPIFFIGDSFTPSGTDDYCLQNRNFLREGSGYCHCLKVLKQIPAGSWLVNQHVAPAFRFSDAQVRQMEEALRQRLPLLSELLPWEDPNYGCDEGWARFYPYEVKARPGETARLDLRITNHAGKNLAYGLGINLPKAWPADTRAERSLTVSAHQTGAAQVSFTIPPNTPPGTYVITADVAGGNWALKEWTEALVTVAP